MPWFWPRQLIATAALCFAGLACGCSSEPTHESGVLVDFRVENCSAIPLYIHETTSDCDAGWFEMVGLEAATLVPTGSPRCGEELHADQCLSRSRRIDPGNVATYSFEAVEWVKDVDEEGLSCWRSVALPSGRYSARACAGEGEEENTGWPGEGTQPTAPFHCADISFVVGPEDSTVDASFDACR